MIRGEKIGKFKSLLTVNVDVYMSENNNMQTNEKCPDVRKGQQGLYLDELLAKYREKEVKTICGARIVF